MIYSLVRPLLFSIEPETAHRLTLGAMRTLERVGLVPAAAPASPECGRPGVGIRFPNPVGLAAGLDKNGEYIDALARLGFGFIEIGTVTPRPQPGNPRPRVFRLPAAQAVINRLGFNNEGVDRLVENVKRARYRGVLGINIGKNFDTPLERAAEDYVACLRKVYPVASYVTVNDYEGQMLQERTGKKLEDLAKLVKALVITLGARGALVHAGGQKFEIPCVKPAAIAPGDSIVMDFGALGTVRASFID